MTIFFLALLQYLIITQRTFFVSTVVDSSIIKEKCSLPTSSISSSKMHGDNMFLISEEHFVRCNLMSRKTGDSSSRLFKTIERWSTFFTDECSATYVAILSSAIFLFWDRVALAKLSIFGNATSICCFFTHCSCFFEVPCICRPFCVQ